MSDDDYSNINVAALEHDYETKAPEFRTMANEFGFNLDWQLQGCMVYMKATPNRVILGTDIMKLNEFLAEWYPGYRVISWNMRAGGVYAVRNIWDELKADNFGKTDPYDD
ncbi:MAG TPA: hypothetical protein VFM18_17555 [Methanosarcina sp.]|nr:hypothetical protein [Methanosarcina sp.]